MLKSRFLLAAFIACGTLAGCAPTSSTTQADTVETGTLIGEVGDPRNRARIHTELASAYFERGNMGVALEELRIAISADPTYAPAYSVLGLVHMDLRENDVAQQNFAKALALSPNDPDINNNYGWFLCRTGREEKSIAYFLAALKNPLYNTPARSYVNAGLCSINLNDGRDAINFFERALRSEPDNPLALLNLASLQYKRGQLEAARKSISRFNKVAEPTAESLWLALRIERKLGDKAAENALAVQLRRRYPGSPEYQNLLKGQFE
ncbi:MAG: type IV pilus biogenesis/stability protein PilW [Burkholderiales bacterium]|nr:type IV pilus biogenesis/stability protein PilW [Burkholderiales bacterium]